jgi:hypothetical protein
MHASNGFDRRMSLLLQTLAQNRLQLLPKNRIDSQNVPVPATDNVV